MTGIFEQAMGADFHALHPRLRRRFGAGLAEGRAVIGRGVMDEIRRGPWWTVPFLNVGRLRSVLIPRTGERIPFTMENYPYRDPHGRETVTFVRTFDFPDRPSRFDATMVLDGDRVLDYLGTHQHLAVPLELSTDGAGGLILRSDAQWFFEGRAAFSFPMSFSGRAELWERWDEAAECFRIQLLVRHERFGFLFGYRGWFRIEEISADDAPVRLKPHRHEHRVPPQR